MNLGHGGNIEEICRQFGINEKNIIDFSANINPYGISEKVKEGMIQAIDKIERYPDITYFNLKEEISKYDNVDSEDILLGNGAAEVIFNIVRGLKPKNALIMAPTFSEYEDALKSENCKIQHYIMKGDFNLDSGFIDAIREDIDIVFLCNPNNPTGALTNREFIIEILEKIINTETILVVDESFIDFIEEKEKITSIKLLNDYSNLVVVKSLTKFFAFPGIRIGYGLCKNKYIKRKIDKVSIPWCINTVAAQGAIIALSQQKYIKDTIQYVKAENEFLYNELSKFSSLKVYRGSVNFMFFKVIKDIDLKSELLKHEILIRSCSNYIGLNEQYYRVAVRTREENIKLIEALRRVI